MKLAELFNALCGNDKEKLNHVATVTTDTGEIEKLTYAGIIEKYGDMEINPDNVAIDEKHCSITI